MTLKIGNIEFSDEELAAAKRKREERARKKNAKRGTLEGVSAKAWAKFNPRRGKSK